MLKVDILQDEELQEILNRFTSALLPHSSYDASMFTTILGVVFRYIHLDEMQMEYKVIYALFDKLSKIKADFGDKYLPALSRDNLVSYLTAQLDSIVTDRDLGLKEWLEYEGMSSNLKVEDAKYAACSKLMERCLALYDTCFELEYASSAVLNDEPALRETFLTHCGNICLNSQRMVILEGMRVGRKYYVGAEGWLEYTLNSGVEIKQRLDNAAGENVITLDDVARARELLHELKSVRMPIAKYGIPELDGDFEMSEVDDDGIAAGVLTPILRHRLVVIVGKENIGKTQFVIDQATNVLLEGRKVVYMCGESNKSKIMCQIIINYIHKKYQKYARIEDIAGISDTTDEMRGLINQTLLEITEKGLLTMTDAFDYATVYEEMQALYEAHKFDVCIIDHSCALIGTVGDGSLKAKVDALADAAKRFRKAYPVCLMVTSHPSTVAKTMDNKESSITDSPTKGSQNLSTDADEVFVLRATEQSCATGTIFLENTKRRDAARITEWITLQTMFEVSRFIYDKQLQADDSSYDVLSEAQNSLSSINYGSDEESLGE